MSRSRPTQAVILAGGRGTRLLPLTYTRPKPMVTFHGEPFMGYMVDMLREQGFDRVLMLLGYLPEVIMEHFRDGSDYGIEIEYAVTDPDDLTAYRVLDAWDRIDDTFLLLYCDNYWPMRFDDMWATYLSSGAPAQVTVYSNSDGFSRSSVIVGDDGFVRVFDRERQTPGLEGVEISYALIEKRAIRPLLGDGSKLFEVAVYPELAQRGELHAYWTEHRYYSVGSLKRLPITDEFLARRPTVVLDRDGVLNERPPRAEYVRRPDDFKWLPGTLEALRMYAEAGWRVLVVTNQAGIGRGLMTEAELEAVHSVMLKGAEKAGGRIDAVYVCPHAWDAGCDCRKPRPGMLYQAQRAHHLDLTRTLFIGDDERDEEAALAAGCRFALVSDHDSLLQITRRTLVGRREAARL